MMFFEKPVYEKTRKAHRAIYEPRVLTKCKILFGWLGSLWEIAWFVLYDTGFAIPNCWNRNPT